MKKKRYKYYEHIYRLLRVGLNLCFALKLFSLPLIGKRMEIKHFLFGCPMAWHYIWQLKCVSESSLCNQCGAFEM